VRENSHVPPRDYRLTGIESQRAVERGLADAQWYHPPVDAGRLQELMVRRNGRTAFHVVVWLGLLVVSGVLAYRSLGSWWAIPAFVVYGALYGGSADSRWHECGHGTAFKSRWANDAVYYMASFMLLREPTLWRWSHVRHHSDTIIVGRDPEIVFPRPPKLHLMLANLLHIFSGTAMVKRMVIHAFGRVDADARDFVPEHEVRRVVWEARAFVAILGGTAVWALASWSIVPLLFIGLPSFYGVWLVVFFGATQHAGLREDVTDHRLNTRTVYMNPVFQFLYLNMNYHVEHHMFPAVPYHQLPALHAEIKQYLPEPQPSTWAAYREIIPALLRQRRDPAYEIADRVIPDGGAARTPVALIEHGQRVDLGDVDDLAVGGLRRVDLGDRTFLLCRYADDGFALTDGLCTHGRAHLAEGFLDGCVIECPKHNGRFDVRTGEPLRRPVTVRLPRYPVEVVDGRIVGDMEVAAIGEVVHTSPSVLGAGGTDSAGGTNPAAP
jgi:fatty acid desaturase/nitrite reductase/ring-hydroxylating ferredoxin subunit